MQPQVPAYVPLCGGTDSTTTRTTASATTTTTDAVCVRTDATTSISITNDSSKHCKNDIGMSTVQQQPLVAPAVLASMEILLSLNATGIACMTSPHVNDRFHALWFFQHALQLCGINLTSFVNLYGLAATAFATVQQQQASSSSSSSSLPSSPSSLLSLHSHLGKDLTTTMAVVQQQQQQQHQRGLLQSIPLPLHPQHQQQPQATEEHSIQSDTTSSPFELFSSALLLQQEQQQEEEALLPKSARHLLVPVLLYNVALWVQTCCCCCCRCHNPSNSNNKSDLQFVAHELYRWSLYFVEEVTLTGQCPVGCDLLLLALFNNLARLNSLFDLEDRVALCREKLVLVLLHCHPNNTTSNSSRHHYYHHSSSSSTAISTTTALSRSDYNFFYEQVIFSSPAFLATKAAAAA